MDALAFLRAFAKLVVLPPAGPLLVAVLGLALMRHAPRLGRALAWGGVLALLVLSLPAVAWLLARPFDRAPFDPASDHRARAIVILGGGLRTAAPEYGGDTPSRLTAERLRYGARVARATGLPVLVTGGTPARARSSEAEVMRGVLANEYGVAVRWSETRSHNTRQNAALSAPLLQADGVSRVILVAHAFDMPRARSEFARQGIEALPAPIGLASAGPSSAADFVPAAAALLASHHALYEYLALAALALGF